MFNYTLMNSLIRASVKQPTMASQHRPKSPAQLQQHPGSHHHDASAAQRLNSWPPGSPRVGGPLQTWTGALGVGAYWGQPVSPLFPWGQSSRNLKLDEAPDLFCGSHHSSLPFTSILKTCLEPDIRVGKFGLLAPQRCEDMLLQRWQHHLRSCAQASQTSQSNSQINET